MREGQRSAWAGDGTFAEAGSLVRMRLAPRQSLWRIAPAWAAWAGVLASGASPMDRGLVLNAIAALILADCVWGALRQVIVIPLLPGPQRTAAQPPRLPYATAAGPLARLLGHLSAATGSFLAWQELLLVALLGAGLSWLLGLPGAAMSASALLVIWLAWAFARRGGVPAFCLALLDVTLPWALGLFVALGELRASWLVAAVIAAFTVLQWGVHRSGARGLTVAWLGHAAVLAALIGAGQAWAVAVVGALLLPPAWWLARRDSPPQALAQSQPWWLAAMLVSALAVR